MISPPGCIQNSGTSGPRSTLTTLLPSGSVAIRRSVIDVALTSSIASKMSSRRASMAPAGISIAANSSDAVATRATSAVTTARVAGPSGSASPAFNALTQAVAKASVASSAVCFLPPDACSHR